MVETKNIRNTKTEVYSQMACCPEISKEPICDTLELRYRLPFRVPAKAERQQNITVEVVLNFRLERCSEKLVLGDPVYSTTLLPGEQVRLFTSDRHTRWSWDSESSLVYRHATTSVESFFTAGMARAMSDLTINESGTSFSSFSESWAEGGGGIDISIPFLFSFGSGGGGGSYDSSSLSTFARSMSRHAESASAYVAASVRAKCSTSIGEVERRAHSEGESETQYESASRVFSNPNKCRAVTYLFYQINKMQTIRFTLTRIERRVEDPAAPTGIYPRVPIDTTGQVTVLPQAIPATMKARLEVEQMARKSALDRSQGLQYSTTGITGLPLSTTAFRVPVVSTVSEPISKMYREAVLHEVDDELADDGIIDRKTSEPTKTFIDTVSWSRSEVLPTPGILVKGCLDNCETCESMLQKEIELDLERKQLENEMLKRQIEILDKSQEYRCCPTGSSEVEESPDT